jgi:hypothetical protein
LPTQALMSSTVNNDAALFALSAAGIAAAAGQREGSRARGLAPLSAVCVLGALAKPTFLVGLPGLVMVAAAAAGPRRLGSWTRPALAILPGVVAGIAWQLLGPRLEPAAASGPTESSLAFLWAQVLSPLRFEALWIKAYWMFWGWGDTKLPIAYYRLLEALLLLSIAGAAMGWRCLARGERRLILTAAGATGATLSLLYAFEYRWYLRTGDLFLQGRYLLPLAALHLAALATGLRGLARRMSAPLDGAFALPVFVAVLLAASSLHALARYYA